MQKSGVKGVAHHEDPSLKLKIITTQIPQSLLISNNASRQGDGLMGRGNLMGSARNHSTGIGGAGNIINSFLVPTKIARNYKIGSVPPSSMPPSLTAINV